MIQRTPPGRLCTVACFKTQGNRLAQDVVKTILKERTDTSFSLFWDRVLLRKTTEIQTIEDPKLPSRKVPVRHGVGEQDTYHFPETPKEKVNGV